MPQTRLHIVLSLATFVSLHAASVSASDWARFRGADGNASVPGVSVPLTWSATENVVWKQEIPGNGASSPVVFSDRIYLTSFTGYGLDPDVPGDRADLRLHVLCFDSLDGNLIWNKSIEASNDEQHVTRRVADHGYATGTPVVDEDGVYAYFGVTGLIAFNHDGDRLWSAKTGEKTAGFGSAASPILYRNLVIMNASIESGTVFAFDKKTGDEVWRIEGIDRSWTTPIVAASSDGRDELVISHKMHVKGFDPLTGKQLWNCEGIQDYVVPCVVVNDGIAYVIGGRKNQSMAIRLGGNGDVTESHRLWDTNIGANVTSPIYHDGLLYWASDRGIATCLDAKTGDKIYQERLQTKQRVYASSILAGDRMYITTRDQGIFAVALGREYRELAHNMIEDDDSLYNATPTVNGNTLLFRTNKFLYCIGEN